MLNALLREELLPVGVLPETACLVRFAWGPERAATLLFADGTEEKTTPEAALARMETLKAQDRFAGLRHLEIRLPKADFHDIEIQDTPGFNSGFLHHELTAERALKSADAVVWVTPIDQAVTRLELGRIRERRKAGARLFVVVNKIDGGYDPAEVEAVLAGIRKDLGPLADEVIGASGWVALERARGRDPGWTGDDGIAQIYRRIAEVVASLPPAPAEDGSVREDLKPSEFRCPGCAAVCERTDKFCVCGRDLADQHRRCPRCEKDNILRRRRCRACNLDFDAYERATKIEAEALKLLDEANFAGAAALLRTAVEEEPDDGERAAFLSTLDGWSESF